MAHQLPPKDIVIIGMGWTGSIVAQELTDAGLDVIALERGAWRNTATDFPPNQMQDELRYRIRHELFLKPAQTTFTFRNRMDGTAGPIWCWVQVIAEPATPRRTCWGRIGAVWPSRATPPRVGSVRI
jgi:gluconate 2-dehydrogenase alpha chain